MSTISLPPINKWITLTSELSHDYSKYISGCFLSDAKEKLASNKLLISNILLLDPGITIRIEAFKALVKSDGWPYTKISIKIPSSKTVKCYVPFDVFERVSWDINSTEDLKAPPKDPPRIFKKIEIEFFNTMLSDLSLNRSIGNVNHPAFGRTSFRDADKDKKLNPLELSPDEIKHKQFTSTYKFNAGTALVRVAKDISRYTMVMKYSTQFKIDTIDGFMLGNKISSNLIVELSPQYSVGSPLFTKEILFENLNDIKGITESIKIHITNFLKTHHNF